MRAKRIEVDSNFKSVQLIDYLYITTLVGLCLPSQRPTGATDLARLGKEVFYIAGFLKGML